ncbi:hypothetical protein Tco_1101145 [Tanacetum coccineum]
MHSHPPHKKNQPKAINPHMIQSWGHQSTHRHNRIHNHSIGQTISLVILEEKVKHSMEDMVRQLILLEDPYRGSTDEQDRANRDLDRITCEETKNLWSFLEDFRQLATKSGRLYFPSTTEKLFAKLPYSLSKKIEESFRTKYPVDFDDSSVYSISEGEGDTLQNISVMVQDTLVEEAVFMAIEEDDESDNE